MLHGGYGISSHTKGLALDFVIGATVVLANSTILNCSATENADLFWALRGAGGSMGIVTEFLFNTFEVPEEVTYFVAPVQWPTEARALVGVQAVQEFAQTMPAELNMRLFIASRFVNLEGLYYGDKEGLQAALAPLIKKTNATLALAQTGGWLDQVKHFGGSSNLDQGHGHQEVSQEKAPEYTIADLTIERNLLLHQPVHPSPRGRATQNICQLLVQASQGKQEGLVCANRPPWRRQLCCVSP